MPPKAKKHLGQNFLSDTNIISRIINSAGITSEQTILEIGPGRGALTEALLDSGARVIAIEKDDDMIPILNDSFCQKNLTVIHDDFLTTDLKALGPIDTIIGNIPYNISSPIIEKLINHRQICSRIFLTVQKEFAKRLVARSSTKDYGALSVFAQYFADIKILFTIPPAAFKPAPKVTSAFVSIAFRQPKSAAIDEKLLFSITRTAFSQRRKKILNSLERLIPKEALEDILAANGYKNDLRADHLSPDDFVTIANAWTKRLEESA